MAADVSIKALVCDYLGALQKAGQLTLPVDEEARAVLRAWMIAKKRGVTLPVATSSPEIKAPPALHEGAEPPVVEDEVRQAMAELHRAVEEPTAENVADEAEEIFFRPGGRTPQESWELAASLLPRWTPLRELGTLRDTLVWGEGPLSAAVMLVGDAPGYYDEREKKPFCGEAGAKLDGVLKAMELTREQVYTTHLVKYRPMTPQQTTNTRPPNRDEVRVSLPVLQFEVGVVKPRVIVALGVIAARALLQLGDLPLAACRQVKDAAFCGVPVVVTHHPSYLLRTTALAERRLLWEDMLRAMEIAQLPISERQRGYFLPKKQTA